MPEQNNVTGRNQYGSFNLSHFDNGNGKHGNSGVFETLTREELYARGGVIIDSTGCHVWTRAKQSKRTYGVIALHYEDNKRKTFHAHRLSLHLTGVIDYHDKVHVLHNCHKPWCINPEHLRPGTNRENIVDRYANRQSRPTWKMTWFRVAQMIALRSECTRRQAGCVIVGHDERINSTGFNGKPDGLNVSGPCDLYCPRSASTGYDLDYSNCTFVHAEMNALMYGDRTQREHGTAYITSCPCMNCAKAISNSGVKRVVCSVTIEDKHREPEKSIRLMMDAGLHVEIHYAPDIKTILEDLEKVDD